MRAVLAIYCIMLLSFGTARAQAFDGHAIAKDGDDLVIGGIDIRLFGIDAFELHQICEAESKTYACGELAKQDLAKKVQGRNVHCEVRRRLHRPLLSRYTGREKRGRRIA